VLSKTGIYFNVTMIKLASKLTSQMPPNKKQVISNFPTKSTKNVFMVYSINCVGNNLRELYQSYIILPKIISDFCW